MNIEFDAKIDIATGRNRKETSWKNKEILWSELLKKVSTTHRTAETYNEYCTGKKGWQDNVKDIGGFVGGYLSGGRRKATSVMHRQLITLDIDFAKPEFWDDFTMMYSNAAAMYSTHKHSVEAPRLRLILPLNRKVFADEYMAIARRIACNLNIECFDDTTYEPSRLMYWPSTAKDGAYDFQYQDGVWLSADEVLSSYRDWKDTSEWPVSTRNYNIIQRAIKKQGDPLEKPGVIGAWCRTYTIPQAIETFLSDVYDPCDVENRYTYKEGSTGAGLVVYDDKYSFSHHGTDPTSGKLCNAFDLVRIHKFGLKDEDREDQKASYAAMQEFCTKDEKVLLQIGIERRQSVEEDFKDVFVEGEDKTEEPESDKWLSDLEVDKKGNYLSTIDNIYRVIKSDPKLKGRIYLNEFEGRLLVTKNLPWRNVNGFSKDFTDDDADCLAHYLEKSKIPHTHIQKALAKIRNEFKIHPVRDYLNSLSWDGEARLDDMFIDYLGAEDSDYTRAVARKTFVAAVARVFQPGCKFDTVLTLVGKEGIGKSTLIAHLAKEWFSDCLGDIHTKEGMESLRGVWIMEIAELASFRRADQDAIKRFLTSREDVYRPAYGRQLVRFPRQCIFFATTNKEEFLVGSHGNRRFWPVSTHVQQPTKDVFADLSTFEINQVWAEAIHFYKKGESLNLSEEMRADAESIRETHSEIDDRAGMVEKYLNTLMPENWSELAIHERRAYLAEDELQPAGTVQRSHVCIAEIWCEALGCMQRDMTNNNTKYIHDIMRKLKEWQPAKGTKRFNIYGTQRVYSRVKTAKNVVNTNVNTKIRV